jgi:hypothetical protein
LSVKKIYSAPNITMVGLVKDVLDSHGIPTVIRNQFLSAATGELPPIECWPELWITDDSRYEECRQLVEEILRTDNIPADPWQCPGCHEEIEGQFSQCWRCGAGRPEPGEK